LKSALTEEMSLLGLLAAGKHETQILLTKSDRLKQSERQIRTRYWQKIADEYGQDFAWHWVSAKSGEGILELRKELLAYQKNIS